MICCENVVDIALRSPKIKHVWTVLLRMFNTTNHLWISHGSFLQKPMHDQILGTWKNIQMQIIMSMINKITQWIGGAGRSFFIFIWRRGREEFDWCDSNKTECLSILNLYLCLRENTLWLNTFLSSNFLFSSNCVSITYI